MAKAREAKGKGGKGANDGVTRGTFWAALPLMVVTHWG